jgi:hypothetical protein
MTPEEERARQLHDQATRGGTLTEEERRQLEAWYSQQDTAEAALLHVDAPVADVELGQLESHISTALQRIGEITRRIHHVTEEISVLRSENEALKYRLARVLHESAG